MNKRATRIKQPVRVRFEERNRYNRTAGRKRKRPQLKPIKLPPIKENPFLRTLKLSQYLWPAYQLIRELIKFLFLLHSILKIR